MTAVVWKYELPISETPVERVIPYGARPVACGQQGNQVVVWYLVPDRFAVLMSVRLATIPTGVTFDATLGRYIGTVQMRGVGVIDPFVVHVFDDSQPPDVADELPHRGD